ncbi:hypothetical protein FQZ97_484470 [compost metagenome]|jgi:hypothetical protein
MDSSRTIRIPLFVEPAKRTTYYSLALYPERCPTWDLHYAFEHNDLMLSAALRPCAFRNDKQIMLLDRRQAEELASYVEPVMQKRYGPYTEVQVMECGCPVELARKAPFTEHQVKAQKLLDKYAASNAPRSQASKILPIAEVTQLPNRK